MKRPDLALRNRLARKSLTGEAAAKVIDLYVNKNYGMRDIAESIGLARGQYRIVKNTLIDNNISIRSIGAMTGTLNSSWKGDEAGQVALHRWLRVHHQKKEICSKCGKQGYTEYANIKGHNYTRNIEDYMEMCKPCHTEYDSN